jgi:hypothetical protein
MDKVALGKVCLFVFPFSPYQLTALLSNALIKDVLYFYAAVLIRRSLQDNVHPDIPIRVLRVYFSLLHPMHRPACWGRVQITDFLLM